MGSLDLKTMPSPAVVTPKGLPYYTPLNNAGAALDPTSPSLPTLFKPLKIRDVHFKNRIMVAPMCMYSCESNPRSPSVGALTDYHIAHLGHIALKGASLVIVEATAVQFNGRITPNDSGLWMEGRESEQFRGLKRVADFVHSQGSKLGVQLAHAGRKASTVAPWLAAKAGVRSLKADESVGGWPEDVAGPTGGEEQIWTEASDRVMYWPPRELSTTEVEELVQAFAKSAKLAIEAGVDVIEIHAAHGYLLNSFLSPVTNRRTDKYGGSFENRIRIVTETASAIRAVIPEGTPLFLRISATEWLEDQPVASETGSWDIPSSIKLAKLLPELGIDLLDVSSGGNHKDQKIEPHTNYQIEIAGEIRKAIRKAGDKATLIGAVGLITQAGRAKDIVEGADESAVVKDANAVEAEAKAAKEMVGGSEGKEPLADAVLIARQFMREPEWVMKVAKELGVRVETPMQFGRAL